MSSVSGGGACPAQRRWQGGAGVRAIARGTGLDRKTIAAYVGAAGDVFSVSAGEGASFLIGSQDYGHKGGTLPNSTNPVTPKNPCGDPPGGVGGTMTPPAAEGGALRAQSFRRPGGGPGLLNGAVLRLDPVTGVVLTASNGHSFEETATDRTDPDGIWAAATELVARIRSTSTNGTGPALDIVPEAPTDADYATPMQIDPASLTLRGRGAGFLILLGYLIIHFFEHTVTPHFHFGEETHKDEFVQSHKGYSVLIGLVIHTFFDGIAIASGFIVSDWLGWIIFTAVFLHKIPEGFTVTSVMLASGRSRGIAWGASVILGAATIAGVLVMALFRHQVAFGLPLSAGVTIYVAASDLIPEVNKEPGVKMALLVFVGVAFLFVLDSIFQLH